MIEGNRRQARGWSGVAMSKCRNTLIAHGCIVGKHFPPLPFPWASLPKSVMFNCRVETGVVCDCRDRLTGNDAIGTTYLNLAKIASSGGEIEGRLVCYFSQFFFSMNPFWKLFIVFPLISYNLNAYHSRCVANQRSISM